MWLKVSVSAKSCFLYEIFKEWMKKIVKNLLQKATGFDYQEEKVIKIKMRLKNREILRNL